ncbi:MAG: hypothetical protein QOE33_2692 [Acidobacteriota bacterium]|nr:hypothetical protein [Acidobacteriota bacterium]
MRVPDNLKNIICYLAVRLADGESFKYQSRGTGFFIAIPGETDSRLFHVYLITARHCIEKVKEHGDLYVRLNFDPRLTDFVKFGDADFLPVPLDDWIFPDDGAIDIAARPFNLLQEDAVVHQALSQSSFATDRKLNTFNVGIGDAVFILGLFSHREGRRKNIPIVRSGNIAAMPEEPLIDENSGQEYEAYLIEVRSLGGLSGSPVFAAQGRGLYSAVAAESVMSPGLLGLIRGHWDLRTRKNYVGYAEDEPLTVNTGIAIVTPIQEVTKLLESDELKKQRRRQEREWLAKNSHLLTSGSREGE